MIEKMRGFCVGEYGKFELESILLQLPSLQNLNGTKD